MKFCIRIFLKRVLGDPIVENKEILSDRVMKCVGMERVMKAENCVEKVKNVSDVTISAESENTVLGSVTKEDGEGK